MLMEIFYLLIRCPGGSSQNVRYYNLHTLRKSELCKCVRCEASVDNIVDNILMWNMFLFPEINC